MTCGDEDNCARSTALGPKPVTATERIRDLNDSLRRTGVGGRTMITRGIDALPLPMLARVLALVRDYDQSKPGDDPYGEHDFGAVEADGVTVFWKIEYYDIDLHNGSSDPADPAVTTRVLTIMLAEDY
jgi:hypothetical protein